MAQSVKCTALGIIVLRFKPRTGLHSEHGAYLKKDHLQNTSKVCREEHLSLGRLKNMALGRTLDPITPNFPVHFSFNTTLQKITDSKITEKRMTLFRRTFGLISFTDSANTLS